MAEHRITLRRKACDTGSDALPRPYIAVLCGLVCAPALRSQSGETVLLVVNRVSNLSRHTADYYVRKRGIPLKNVCMLNIPPETEEISWQTYLTRVEQPIANCLAKAKLQERILYIVTTMGVPLKVAGSGGGHTSDASSVDSELTLLYSKMKGKRFPRAGFVPNPYYRQKDQPFRHERFPIYLVTRLAGYDFTDIQGMIDRSLAARNRGKFVFDLKSADDRTGNNWLRTAALALPQDRVILDESPKVLTGVREVIGYAGWGSNDPNRHQRDLGFQWLPGALVSEYVSTDGRTFQRPPAAWNIGTWADPSHWFVGSPQTLTADYIHEGATGCSGHVYEPYLEFTPHPDQLFPAYFQGRNLAESYYAAIPGLSWQNIVVGDPLCRLQ
ncbi:MAG TPA: TIGR03790 family protein [Bryobacteraceae bacterium]|nr:TIGR03790 family protein [Bryobacteraceae bacterium]